MHQQEVERNGHHGTAPSVTPRPLPPIQRPVRRRSFALEDLDTIPKIIFQSANTQQWAARVLREALRFPEQLGNKLPEEIFRIQVEENMLTLKGRMLMFPPDWQGMTPLILALGGLYLNQIGRLACFMCGVELRTTSEPDMDPLQLHRQLAPNCQQLKRYSCDGLKPIPEGKQKRRNSAGDIYDLLKSVA
ncbi:uncharacterized protein [Littorina saxatilis]|uniref:Uncharacterized protein n=1 Tax=Littorina saxatilis TaxID=31220 RepID=A0AAN9BM53_9CAEN